MPTPEPATSATPAFRLLRGLAATIALAGLACTPVAGETGTGVKALCTGLGLDAARMSRLEADESIMVRGGASWLPTLLAPGPVRDSCIAQLGALRPQIVLEYLHAMPLPAAWQGTSDKDIEALTDSMHTLFTSFRALEGITYWSDREQKETTLILYSRRINNPKDRREMPDPSDTPPRGTARWNVLQEDNRLGRNLYDIILERTGPDTLSYTMSNQEQVSWGIIPVIRPRGMLTRLVVTRNGDTLLFYGLSAFDVPNLFGIDEKVSSSYNNRFEALFKWLRTALESKKPSPAPAG